jgi:iron-sulfur cluster assembly protein
VHAPNHRRRVVGGEGEAMITMTEEAKVLFLQAEHPEGTVLRLDPVVDQNTGETQIGIAAGEPRGDDQVVEHEGESLLHIAARVSKALDGGTLDVVQTPEGPGIGLTTPNSAYLTDDS